MLPAPAARGRLQAAAVISELSISPGVMVVQLSQPRLVRDKDRVQGAAAPPGTLLFKATGTVLPGFRPTFNIPLNQKT